MLLGTTIAPDDHLAVATVGGKLEAFLASDEVHREGKWWLGFVSGTITHLVQETVTSKHYGHLALGFCYLKGRTYSA